MRASRRSHSSVSYGCVPAWVKYRRIPIPICSGAIAIDRLPFVSGVPGVCGACGVGSTLLGAGPQDIAVAHAATTTCGGSLHHRNYGRVNGGAAGGAGVTAGQAAGREIPLVNSRTRPGPGSAGPGRVPLGLRRLLEHGHFALEVGDVLEALVHGREPEVR